MERQTFCRSKGPPRESPDVVGTAAQLGLRHGELRRTVTGGGKALCTGDCLELESKGGGEKKKTCGLASAVLGNGHL